MTELELAERKVKELRGLYNKAIDDYNKAEKEAHELFPLLEDAMRDLEQLTARKTA